MDNGRPGSVPRGIAGDAGTCSCTVASVFGRHKQCQFHHPHRRRRRLVSYSMPAAWICSEYDRLPETATKAAATASELCVKAHSNGGSTRRLWPLGNAQGRSPALRGHECWRHGKGSSPIRRAGRSTQWLTRWHIRFRILCRRVWPCLGPWTMLSRRHSRPCLLGAGSSPDERTHAQARPLFGHRERHH